MAGRVGAHLELGRDGSTWRITPDVCPLADEHRREAGTVDPLLLPACQTYDGLVGRRSCVYWYATTATDNACDRLDGSMIYQLAMAKSQTQVRCGVLCMGQRRNRPPGV